MMLALLFEFGSVSLRPIVMSFGVSGKTLLRSSVVMCCVMRCSCGLASHSVGLSPHDQVVVELAVHGARLGASGNDGEQRGGVQDEC